LQSPGHAPEEETVSRVVLTGASEAVRESVSVRVSGERAAAGSANFSSSSLPNFSFSGKNNWHGMVWSRKIIKGVMACELKGRSIIIKKIGRRNKLGCEVTCLI
jgi:hypothetical protein